MKQRYIDRNELNEFNYYFFGRDFFTFFNKRMFFDSLVNTVIVGFFFDFIYKLFFIFFKVFFYFFVFFGFFILLIKAFLNLLDLLVYLECIIKFELFLVEVFIEETFENIYI